MGIKRWAINYGAKQGSSGNFNTERLQLNNILVPYGSKKMMRERIDLFVFSLVRTLS